MPNSDNSSCHGLALFIRIDIYSLSNLFAIYYSAFAWLTPGFGQLDLTINWYL